jgi:hypothetical protein
VPTNVPTNFSGRVPTAVPAVLERQLVSVVAFLDDYELDALLDGRGRALHRPAAGGADASTPHVLRDAPGRHRRPLGRGPARRAPRLGLRHRRPQASPAHGRLALVVGAGLLAMASGGAVAVVSVRRRATSLSPERSVAKTSARTDFDEPENWNLHRTVSAAMNEREFGPEGRCSISRAYADRSRACATAAHRPKRPRGA